MSQCLWMTKFFIHTLRVLETEVITVISWKHLSGSSKSIYLLLHFRDTSNCHIQPVLPTTAVFTDGVPIKKQQICSHKPQSRCEIKLDFYLFYILLYCRCLLLRCFIPCRNKHPCYNNDSHCRGPEHYTSEVSQNNTVCSYKLYFYACIKCNSSPMWRKPVKFFINK